MRKTVITCDRYGKEVTEKAQSAIKQCNPMYILLSDDRDKGMNDIDLCWWCYIELTKWIRNDNSP